MTAIVATDIVGTLAWTFAWTFAGTFAGILAGILAGTFVATKEVPVERADTHGKDVSEERTLSFW